jgi:hypothetical protein
MSDNHVASYDRDARLENFAAELTSAAYPLALRHGMSGSWIAVELGLWRALAETVKKWAREWPPAGSSDEFEAWREGLLVDLTESAFYGAGMNLEDAQALERLLVDLTESAFYVAVKHGIKGSLLEVELGLYRAFRLVVRRRCRAR